MDLSIIQMRIYKELKDFAADIDDESINSM